MKIKITEATSQLGHGQLRTGAAPTGSQGLTMYISSRLSVHGAMLVTWNQPRWEYLHYRNQQILQSRASPQPLESQLFKMYHWSQLRCESHEQMSSVSSPRLRIAYFQSIGHSWAIIIPAPKSTMAASILINEQQRSAWMPALRQAPVWMHITISRWDSYSFHLTVRETEAQTLNYCLHLPVNDCELNPILGWFPLEADPQIRIWVQGKRAGKVRQGRDSSQWREPVTRQLWRHSTCP